MLPGCFQDVALKGSQLRDWDALSASIFGRPWALSSSPQYKETSKNSALHFSGFLFGLLTSTLHRFKFSKCLLTENLHSSVGLVSLSLLFLWSLDLLGPALLGGHDSSSDDLSCSVKWVNSNPLAVTLWLVCHPVAWKNWKKAQKKSSLQNVASFSFLFSSATSSAESFMTLMNFKCFCSFCVVQVYYQMFFTETTNRNQKSKSSLYFAFCFFAFLAAYFIIYLLSFKLLFFLISSNLKILQHILTLLVAYFTFF